MYSGKRNKPHKDPSLICDKTYDYDNHCICCCKPANKKRKSLLSSTENGMKQLKEAAEIRNDVIIISRLQYLERREISTFYYHMEKCYRTYCNPANLELIAKSKKQKEEEKEKKPVIIAIDDSDSQPGTSGKVTTRSAGISTRNPAKSATVSKREVEHVYKCIICNNISKDKDYTKHRLEESDAAQEFLDAVNHYNDSVKTRLADIENIERLIASDIYYHDKCMRTYLMQYRNSTPKCIFCDQNVFFRMQLDIDTVKFLLKRARDASDIALCCKLLDCFDEAANTFVSPCFSHESCKNNYVGSVHNRREIYMKHTKPLVDEMLFMGYYLTISEIRDQLQELHPEIVFCNKKIREYLSEEFGSKISFCKPYKLNDSTIVYPSYITTSQIVAKIQNLNLLKKAGEVLRTTLFQVNFGLNDSFCDCNDLKDSWSNTSMPETLVEFFAGLLKVSKVDLMGTDETTFRNDSKDKTGEENSNVEGDNSEPKNKKSKTKPKVLLAQSLFQTLYYNVHHGRRKTPLQVMLAHNVYDKCKSEELITSLNHLGFCISYSEYRRSRNLLVGYALKEGSDERVPLPSHLNKDDFTIAAFDNFDHHDSSSLSGTKSNHDTVTVIFQNITPENEKCRKNKVSEFGPLPECSNLVNKLDCQNLETYFKPLDKKIPLPQNFESNISNSSYEENNRSEIISAARNLNPPTNFLNLHQIEYPEIKKIPTWAGVNALTSESNLSLKKVGFLPILPHPVTKHETVYTELVNLNSIAIKLKQDILPFVCDEGVYHIVVDIYMHNPEIFKNLFPMLGGFHMGKAAMRCAGKYLRGSGIEDGLIEGGIFGPNVLEAVLNGSHYYRSFKGLLIVEDAIKQLKSEGFWLKNDPEGYKTEIVSLAKFKTTLVEMDSRKAKSTLREINDSKGLLKLLDAFSQFTDECSQKSELCLFWENFIKIVDTIKKLVRADRDGDFLLHIKTVGELCSIFTGGDGIHYMRCASFYHELLKGLKDSHPRLYASFLQGDFVVKTKKGSFNAVACDMKLEQTIQRSSKSSHGIIGQSRVLNYVTQWQLLYHEVLDISNAFREITSGSSDDSETKIHHELSAGTINEINASIEKVKDFIRERANPYCLEESTVKLKNISSQVIAEPDVANKFLKFHELSQQKFNDFRKKVYVERTLFLADKITKFQLEPVDFIAPDKSSDSKDVKRSDKEIKQARKILNTAKAKSSGLESILKYDITSYNPLFDRMYMTRTDNKAQLIAELEVYLLAEHYDEQVPLPEETETAVVIDFMSFVRNQVINSNLFEHFDALVQSLYDRSVSICPNKLVHFVFDSYIAGSLKGPERDRRGQSALELAKIDEKTKIPTQIDKFWASSNNKVLFQEFAAKKIVELGKKQRRDIVVSGVIIEKEKKPCKRIDIQHSHPPEVIEIPYLKSDIEEADQRIIPHIQWSLLEGFKYVVVISNDTDVAVLLIHYYKKFQASGVKKLWIRVGTGKKKRFIPIHTLHARLPAPLCKVLLAAHIGTGCDYISKIGTKLACLNAIPEMYLKGFGTRALDEQQIKNCEAFLVNVYKANAFESTFDKLRCSEYRKNDSIFNLPPTSHSIVNGHIPRWYFIVRSLSNLLNSDCEQLDPTDYQWKLDNDELLPEKQLLLIPDNLTYTCNCQTSNIDRRCKFKTCKCKKAESYCTEFCGCKTLCQNIHACSMIQPRIDDLI